jgi:hypothetical protein
VGEGATGAAESRGAGVADELDEPLSELRHAWDAGLPRALGEESWLASAPAVARPAGQSAPADGLR